LYFPASGYSLFPQKKDCFAVATYVGLKLGFAAAYRMGLLNPFVELQYLTVFRSNAAVKTIPLLIGFRLGRRSDY
jgi:hypothetical protein